MTAWVCRQGMVSGLYTIASADKEERDKALEAARAAAAAPAAVATGKGSGGTKPEVVPVLGQRPSNATVKAEVKAEVKPDGPLDDLGKPWAKVKPEGGGARAKVKQERHGGCSGSDSDSASEDDRWGDSDDDGWGDDYDEVGSSDDWGDLARGAGKENSRSAKAGVAGGKAVGAGKQNAGVLSCSVHALMCLPDNCGAAGAVVSSVVAHH